MVLAKCINKINLFIWVSSKMEKLKGRGFISSQMARIIMVSFIIITLNQRVESSLQGQFTIKVVSQKMSLKEWDKSKAKATVSKGISIMVQEPREFFFGIIIVIFTHTMGNLMSTTSFMEKVTSIILRCFDIAGRKV